MNDLKTVTARVEIKSEEAGVIEGVFAEFGTVDRHRDVTEPGAIQPGLKAILSSYEHSSVLTGAEPVGWAEVKTSDTEAWFEAHYLMQTARGREAFQTVKALHEQGLDQWSYMLENVKAEPGVVDGQNVRIIKSTGIAEISPVRRGAGTNTRSVLVKSAGLKALNSDVAEQLRNLGRERFGSETTYVHPEDYDTDAGYVVYSIYGEDETERLIRVNFTSTDDVLALEAEEVEVERDVVYATKSAGSRFSDELTTVLASVKSVADRAEEVMALRAAKGKTITDGAAQALAQVGEQVQRIKSATAPTAGPASNDADALRLLEI